MVLPRNKQIVEMIFKMFEIGYTFSFIVFKKELVFIAYLLLFYI
jgi:hypothetical protein